MSSAGEKRQRKPTRRLLESEMFADHGHFMSALSNPVSSSSSSSSGSDNSVSSASSSSSSSIPSQSVTTTAAVVAVAVIAATAAAASASASTITSGRTWEYLAAEHPAMVWKAYDKCAAEKLNAHLETIGPNTPAIVRSGVDNWKYEIDFQKMTQTNVEHPTHRQRRLRCSPPITQSQSQ